MTERNRTHLPIETRGFKFSNKLSESLNPKEKEAKIDEFLNRAMETIFPSPEALKERMMLDEKLTAYMGIDPTAPEMHIGHISQLHKLKSLQDLGHEVILLIGDFTARIGDPSDKSSTRIKLTHEQVLENAKTYKDQAAKILNFDENHPNPVNLRFNSEWLDQLTFSDVIELASEVTVQQIMQRDMFQKRISEKKPIHLHEFLYPLMQGYDSVAMNVDIEVGGSDQTFNMLIGRDYVRRHLNKEKFVVAGKLVVDPSGKKMGKSEGNMITANQNPVEMFHKIMQWGDQIVPHALELVTSMPMTEINKISQQMKNDEIDGITAKKLLARTIIGELHSPKDAILAEKEYENIISGNLNKNLLQFNANTGSTLINLIFESGLAQSKSAARRLIEQGGVRLNGQQIKDVTYVLDHAQKGIILQVGKKTQNSYRLVDIE